MTINERMAAAGVPGRPYTIAAQLDWAAAELDRLEAQLNFSNATITELRGQLEKMAAERDSLKQQLTDAQERERQLNDELYYACELAIAYAHSAKDQEWAAERIEELKPPERELPAPPKEVADESV